MKSVKYTIDRFEGNIAVLLQRDDESIQKVIPLSLLGDVNEGDVVTLTFNNGEVVNVNINVEETNQVRQQVKDLLKRLNGKHD